MRKNLLVVLLTVLLTFFFLSLLVYADGEQGVLKGRIFDSSTKEGLGGIQVAVTGQDTKSTTVTDDFGDFTLKLNPGQYIAKIEQIPQSIGFVILPGKTALLDIPLKATAKPSNAPIPYTVKYTADQSPQESEKKVQPFIEAPPSQSTPPPQEAQPAVQPPMESGGTYPMGKLVTQPSSTDSQPLMEKGVKVQTIAVVQFKDTTGRGLGLMVAQDISDNLFDLGKAKIVGPDSVSAAIGGEPADPLNGAFGTWVSKRLGADVVVLGHIKETKIEHHQYLFIVTEQAVINATVVLMDSRTGNILKTFTETGESGKMGMSGNKDRYFEDQVVADLFAKASKDLAEKISNRLLEESEQN